MKKVAIAGGIGSGKSTVARVFEMLGIPIYYSDLRARVMMDMELRREIIGLFGDRAYNDQGLDRQHIASLVFQDKDLLLKLNQIVHPAVKEDFVEWSAKQNAPYTIIETALLCESAIDKIVDQIIVVTAPLDLRIQRVIQRDSATKNQVEARIKAQTPQSELIQLAHYTVDTQDKVMVLPQIIEIHNRLVEKE